MFKQTLHPEKLQPINHNTTDSFLSSFFSPFLFQVGLLRQLNLSIKLCSVCLPHSFITYEIPIVKCFIDSVSLWTLLIYLCV